MRIATWNINGLRARFDFLLHWLRTREPDILGLQELKLTDESFPYAELEAAGYRAVAHTQKAWNGVAILSREEPVMHQQGLPGEEEQSQLKNKTAKLTYAINPRNNLIAFYNERTKLQPQLFRARDLIAWHRRAIDAANHRPGFGAGLRCARGRIIQTHVV